MSVFSEFLLGENRTSPIVPKYLSDYINIAQRNIILIAEDTVVYGSEPPIGGISETLWEIRYNITQDVTDYDTLKQWSNIVITPTDNFNGHRIEIYSNMDFENPIYTGDLSFLNNFELCLIPQDNTMFMDDNFSEPDMLIFKKITADAFEEETPEGIVQKVYMQTKVKIYDSTDNLILESTLVLENVLT